MKSEKIDETLFRYQLPNEEWLINKYAEFEEFLDECKKKIKIEEYDIEINHVLLFNIFVRIDERKDYFMYFHSEENTMHMSLGKEIALEAYWISKYKPFRIKNIKDEAEFTKKYKVSISDVIAAMLIIGFLIDKNVILDNYFTPKKINTLIYDLFNRDISKESMIMYVESFLTEDDEENETN